MHPVQHEPRSAAPPARLRSGPGLQPPHVYRLGAGPQTTKPGMAPPSPSRNQVLASRIASFSRDTSRARLSAHFTRAARLGRQPGKMCVPSTPFGGGAPNDKLEAGGAPNDKLEAGGAPNDKLEAGGAPNDNLGRHVSAGACGSIFANIYCGGRSGRPALRASPLLGSLDLLCFWGQIYEQRV